MTGYNVKFTDFVNKGSLAVDENSVNTETSLVLTGRNFTDYGEIVNENFLHLLENFANNNSPANPVEGQLWYDTTAGVEQLKIYDGTTWLSAGGIKKSTSQPEATNSIPGDLWVDTTNQQLYLYSGSGWVLVGPEYSEGISTGAKFDIIISSTNKNVPVIKNIVNNIVVSIISSGYTDTGEFINSFIPKSAISGFSTIYPGHNLASNITGTPLKYYGIGEKTENLLVNGVSYPGSEFARLNADNNFKRTVRISSNGGLRIGETETLILSVSGSASEIRNAASDGNIDFKVNNAGSTTTALRIFNNGRVAIGPQNPTEALDIAGNIVTTGSIKTNLTTDSSSTSTGALVVLGGAGIAKNLNVGGSLNIANGLNTLTVNDILPNATNTKNIGSSAFKFNGIYAQNFYGNLTGNVTGNLTGSATNAGKLSSATTFAMSGDITAPSFTFDGQIGGTTKTFVTTLSDTYFTNKTSSTAILVDDEILINRIGEGLLRVSQETLTSKVPNSAQGPLLPIGTILPFAGTTAPAGFFICDGTEREVTLYGNLFNIIGNSFGTPSSISFFKLPDFRGRTLLGWLNGATTGNRVLNDGAANTIGNYGGSERDLIDSTQLPDHYHNLMGDDGTQFYTTSNVTGTVDSASTAISIVGGDPGSGMTRTQGIEGFTTQSEFDTVPPFGTVNFIIYHGVF